MEDMARLALVEQSVRDGDKLSKILFELLQHISNILENPHDYELRTIKSDILKEVLKCDAFSDYLKYVGFRPYGTELIYPKEYTLSNLRMAQVAIERKISFCCGSGNLKRMSITFSLTQPKKSSLRPANILKTKNPLLLKIEALFNNMIVYEDEELQALAREQIPIVTLQLMALDRVREQQKGIKTGAVTGHDLPFDVALLMELLGWFKYKFFSWVDKPECEQCGGPTMFTYTVSHTTERETCRMEMYKCTVCATGLPSFARYNDARTLLRTRRGRCGEWANCFALVCRALGYDTRYVYDTTDHVWCEVFDYDSNTWLHADPCEAKLNAPLLYSHGWGKKLSYVIAVSRDDLQDVTWRYTTDHKEVLKRRNLCDEQELMLGLMALRDHRQKQVSEPRRRYLAKRAVQELVQLMVERKPSDYESHGRISGSKQWRMERMELGTEEHSHTFEYSEPGEYCVRYHTSTDKYHLIFQGAEKAPINTWAAGVYASKNIFRKTENDWKKVYLAREDGDTPGTVSWRFAAVGERLQFTRLSIRLSAAVFETGVVSWTLKYDDAEPVPVTLGESPAVVEQQFRAVTISAKLSGGAGGAAWQHAQLFRRALHDHSCALEVATTVSMLQSTDTS